MAATETVSQLPPIRNSTMSPLQCRSVAAAPRSGVITVYGYDVKVCVHRGHLVIDDGIGRDRHQWRLPRVGHGLRRLVVIGADGVVSLAALRWLADQDVAFVMLERDGKVLATTGPVRPSDARLRRAQATAAHTGVDVTIARELIGQKLAGQERVARDKLHDSAAAQLIDDCRLGLAETETLDAIRLLESQGAAAYWATWRDIAVMFPRKDLLRVPEHWRSFGTRKSLLTGSPRLATNPANAMLNYLYALLESESRLAAAALGLDPGLGFIHLDATARDSLACDLMEAVRPQVDAYVLDWLTQQPLSRDWLFEERNGNCRLMAAFAVRLAETAPMWARAVAPVAEWVAGTLWSGRRRAVSGAALPTRLTQRRKREAKGSDATPHLRVLHPLVVCRSCGVEVVPGRTHCPQCALGYRAERMTEVARSGREVAHTPEARAKRAGRQPQHRAAQSAWLPTSQPEWLTEQVYLHHIRPRLASRPNSAIATAMGVSLAHASLVRRGIRRPHPRHWAALAQLVSVAHDLFRCAP